MWGMSRRPSIQKRIQDDPIAFVDELHEEYEAYRRAEREEKRDLIQKCAFLTVSLTEDETFRKIKKHRYWRKSRQKPKQNGRAKWAMYMMLRPTTPASRKIAGKYGRVVDALFAEGIAPEDVAATIEERHGMKPILERWSKRKKAGKNGQTPGGPEDDANEAGDRDQEDGDVHNNNPEADGSERGEGEGLQRPTLPKAASSSDSEVQSTSFSTRLKDNLFVRFTPSQFAVAFERAGKIVIWADISKKPGDRHWLTVATDIQRVDV